MNWQYFQPRHLKLKAARNIYTGEIMTEDKVRYSAREVDLLRGSGLTQMVHDVKRIFEGEVVEVKERKG